MLSEKKNFLMCFKEPCYKKISIDNFQQNNFPKQFKIKKLETFHIHERGKRISSISHLLLCKKKNCW